MKWADGNSYYGEWSNDKKHGFGVYLSTKDGAVYVGQFRDDLREGEGVYFYPDGRRYQGPFKGDKQHGVGVFTYAGKKEKRRWENGVVKQVLETWN